MLKYQIIQDGKLDTTIDIGKIEEGFWHSIVISHSDANQVHVMIIMVIV